MKNIILDFETQTHNLNELIDQAISNGFINFLVSRDSYSNFKTIKKINLYSRDFQIPAKYRIYEDLATLQKDLDNKIFEGDFGYYVDLRTKEDETKIIEQSKTGQIDFVIVSAKDWKIIPFENLIAALHDYNTELIAKVQNVEEAEVMLKVLQIGVDGIIVKLHDISDILNLKNYLFTTIDINLTKAKVINKQSIPESERVCIDTTSLLQQGEGMLIGSTAMGFVLIHAEIFESQFVASRPFRVNAGDVSAYILVPSEDPDTKYQTKYLSELKGGDQVLIINTKGQARKVSIGRVKIETRPMIRLELEVKKGDKKIPIKYIGQNAETIRLINTNNNFKSIVDINVGDEVLVHIGPGATHFGKSIKEKIVEK
jgi:3-dehydroquinate synthase II